MGGGTILVIDDDRLVRMTLRAILESEDYHVLEASDGACALDIIDHHRPNAVLLDLMMPGMNGREFLQNLRSKRRDRVLPVIVMTALRGALPSQFLALGASDFVRKPFDQDALLNKVALAIERSSETDTLPDRPAAPRRNVVLWIDRNRDRRRELNRLLSERGFTMVSVTEVNDQLSRLARALEPRAIVLNMANDEHSTLAALRHLRDEPSLDPVPILATSPDRGDIRALDAATMSDPLDHDAIIDFLAAPPRSAARPR